MIWHKKAFFGLMSVYMYIILATLTTNVINYLNSLIPLGLFIIIYFYLIKWLYLYIKYNPLSKIVFIISFLASIGALVLILS